MRRSLPWVPPILIVLILVAGCARQPASVDELVDAFFTADSEQNRSAAIRALTITEAPVDQVAERLRAGWSHFEDVEPGWTVQDVMTIDGVARPAHRFVPETYDPSIPHPLVVYLHGGVERPEPRTEMAVERALWEPILSQLDAIGILPSSDIHATWWSRAGHRLVLEAVDLVKRECNLDEDRIFLAGFSDGGSGAFWMALHDPTPWAGFVSLLGDPTVAANGPYLCYPGNLVNRPIRVVAGVEDSLYPARILERYVDAMGELGVEIAWAAHSGGHDLAFFDDEAPALVEFFEKTSRDPTPTRVVWETSDVRVGRCDWVRINRIAAIGNDCDCPDLNLPDARRQALLGIYVDPSVEDEIVVLSVLEGTTAEDAGLRAGDRILAVNGIPVDAPDVIGRVMEGLGPGDDVAIEVVRDGVPERLAGAIPQVSPAYPRGKTAAFIEAVAEGNRIDVRVRNVERYTLYLSSRQFDLDRPIEVITNGQTTYHDTVIPNMAAMLARTATDADRTRIYEASLSVEVFSDGAGAL